MENQFARLLQRLSGWPAPWRHAVVGFGFGLYTPYFRTNRCRILDLQAHRVTVGIRLRRRVRNHVGGIHAVAATLAAEYASGLLVGQHVPDSAIVVVKTIHVDLRKPNKGSIRATATITPDNARAISLEPKGTLQVPITIEDEQGQTPITGYMEMAWLPKRKPA
jgi:acyl-coenzyme A thioesterase PaaI-like protein